MKKTFFKILALFFFWRVGLFIVSFVAPSFLKLRSIFSYPLFLVEILPITKRVYLWANFDGVHYLSIVFKGYVGTALIQAFFPVYPILIKLVSLIKIHPIIAGLFVSNLSFFVFLLFFYSLIKHKFNQKIAWLSILGILTFPTSFYFGAIYTESTFLLLVVASFYFAGRKNWFLAGLLAGLASATKIVGILLVPALVVELLVQQVPIQQSWGKIQVQKIFASFKGLNLKSMILNLFFISLGSLGLLSYMYYLYIAFDDPFYFYHVQSEFGGGRQESLIMYPQVVWRYVKILWTVPFGLKYYAYFQEFVAGTVGLVLLLLPVFSKIKSYFFSEHSSGLVSNQRFEGLTLKMTGIPVSWILFSLGAFFVPTLTGTFSSMPRYILVCFPIFIIIALMIEKRKEFQIIYFTLSTLLLIINTILFIQGYWVA